MSFSDTHRRIHRPSEPDPASPDRKHTPPFTPCQSDKVPQRIVRFELRFDRRRNIDIGDTHDARTNARRDRPDHHDGLGRSYQFRCDSYSVRIVTRRRHSLDASRDEPQFFQNVAQANARACNQARTKIRGNASRPRSASLSRQIPTWLVTEQLTTSRRARLPAQLPAQLPAT